jgi:hypothetical protein
MTLTSTEKENLEKALRDVSEIKTAIRRVGRVQKFSSVSEPQSLHLWMHCLLSAIGLVLLVRECFVYPSLTEVIYYTYLYEKLRWICIGVIAAVVVVFVAAFYLSVRHAARKEGEEFASYVSRNFVYLQNLSFLSDLLLKFIVIALILVARRPDWVASVLLMFAGDYLIQGRLFILPLRASLYLGIVCILGGVVQLIFFNGELAFFFAVVFILSLLSVLHIRKLRSAVETDGV